MSSALNACVLFTDTVSGPYFLKAGKLSFRCIQLPRYRRRSKRHSNRKIAPLGSIRLNKLEKAKNKESGRFLERGNARFLCGGLFFKEGLERRKGVHFGTLALGNGTRKGGCPDDLSALSSATMEVAL